MVYTIRNDELTVKISDLGAELQSLADRDGNEYLWQGDPAFWEGRAPVLFPLCGRTWEDQASVEGVPCHLGLHGFFHRRLALAEPISESAIRFIEQSDADTLSDFPRAFRLTLTYRLDGSTLTIHADVENTGEQTLHYAYGGHPGFRLPFAGGKKEDCFVRFAGDGIRKVRFDSSCRYPVGGTEPIALAGGNTFPVSEEPFRSGSFFLSGTGEEATLSSHASDRKIVLRYPGFPYLGLWKVPGAEFLCLEPWSSMPAYFGKPLELSEREDFFHLPAGETARHEYQIQIL